MHEINNHAYFKIKNRSLSNNGFKKNTLPDLKYLTVILNGFTPNK